MNLNELKKIISDGESETVECWGSGIINMLGWCKENGNKSPEWKADSDKNQKAECFAIGWVN
ncbi:hypothetical protein ACFL5V_06195 [Fibrobacterota bacterium]